MSDIVVRYEGGDRFAVGIRGHELIIDQPVEDGGTDRGPTPTELFVAGLASCVAYYAGRFLRRHDLRTEGLSVRCRFGFADDRPNRVGAIEIEVELPESFPEERREALLRVVEHCTVHNSIRREPEIAIVLAVRREAA